MDAAANPLVTVALVSAAIATVLEGAYATVDAPPSSVSSSTQDAPIGNCSSSSRPWSSIDVPSGSKCSVTAPPGPSWSIGAPSRVQVTTTTGPTFAAQAPGPSITT